MSSKKTNKPTVEQLEKRIIELESAQAESKRKEKVLEASLQRYRVLSEAERDCIYMIDRGKKVVYVNRMAARQFHSTPEEVVGKPLSELFPPPICERMEKNLDKVFETGEQLTTENKIVFPDKTIWMSVVLVPFRNESGEVEAVLGSSQDTTERRQWDEAQKRRQKALVTLALDSSFIAGDVAEAARKLTEIVAEVLRVERVGVWLLENDDSRLHCRDMYLRSKGSHSSGDVLVSYDYPVYFASLERERAVDAHDTARDVRTSELRESYLEPHGITSMLDIPVRLRGRVAGVVCLEHTGEPRTWHSDETAFAGQVADQMAQVLANAERNRAEDLLKESENKWHQLYDNLPGGSFAVNDEYMIEDVNEVLCRLTGFTREELVGSRCGIICPKGPHKCPIFDLGKERIENDETAVRTKDNEFVPIIKSARRIRLSGKELIVENFQDITELKATERALRESEERFRELAEMLPETIFESDLDLNLTFVNNTALEQFGYTRRDFERGLNGLDMLVPEDRTKARADLEKRLSGEDISAVEYTGLRKDGSAFPIMLQASLIHDEGRPAGIRGIIVDISDRKKLEEELARIAKLESLGLLAGGIAHDFNNILSIILGNISLAGMIVRDEDDSRAVESLQAAETACGRARDLTQQLLTFSKGGEPVKKTVALPALVREAAEFALRGSNVVCKCYIPEDLRPCDIDEGQISQVVNNLIINADQAMPGGGTIRIRAGNVNVSRRDRLPLESGEYVRLTIEDEGPGIPGEHLSRVFDPYFTTKQKGSGLGLTTAYSIIQKHTGHITVESGPKGGALFQVYLPASNKTVERIRTERSGIESSGGRILVMDDEEGVCNIAARMLEQMGHDAERAYNGVQAIEMYRKAMESGQPFDAVILDLTIPGGMGGRETMERLLEIDPDVRGVVSSGYSNDAVMAHYRDHGFSSVVTKPYRIDELSEALNNVLQAESG